MTEQLHFFTSNKNQLAKTIFPTGPSSSFVLNLFLQKSVQSSKFLSSHPINIHISYLLSPSLLLWDIAEKSFEHFVEADLAWLWNYLDKSLIISEAAMKLLDPVPFKENIDFTW